ncbi:hypothetical protein V8G54_033277 [Vigna mungo]|uniref:Uncharacterized protein n=1 Tax=Vigna mungo TaxID=3915 RepID=A0AAQ3MP19_VIGMU
MRRRLRPMSAPSIVFALRRPLVPRPRRFVTSPASVFVLRSLLGFATSSTTTAASVVLRPPLLPPLSPFPLRTSPSATTMAPLTLTRLTVRLSFLQPLRSRRRRARARGRIRRTGIRPSRPSRGAGGTLMLFSQ